MIRSNLWEPQQRFCPWYSSLKRVHPICSRGRSPARLHETAPKRSSLPFTWGCKESNSEYHHDMLCFSVIGPNKKNAPCSRDFQSTKHFSMLFHIFLYFSPFHWIYNGKSVHESSWASPHIHISSTRPFDHCPDRQALTWSVPTSGFKSLYISSMTSSWRKSEISVFTRVPTVYGHGKHWETHIQETVLFHVGRDRYDSTSWMELNLFTTLQCPFRSCSRSISYCCWNSWNCSKVTSNYSVVWYKYSMKSKKPPKPSNLSEGILESWVTNPHKKGSIEHPISSFRLHLLHLRHLIILKDSVHGTVLPTWTHIETMGF